MSAPKADVLPLDDVPIKTASNKLFCRFFYTLIIGSVSFLKMTSLVLCKNLILKFCTELRTDWVSYILVVSTTCLPARHGDVPRRGLQPVHADVERPRSDGNSACRISALSLPVHPRYADFRPGYCPNLRHSHGDRPQFWPCFRGWCGIQCDRSTHHLRHS